jgi:hypothetical protein
MIILKGGGGVDMVMCEDDMRCCCNLIGLNGEVSGYSQGFFPVSTVCRSPSQKLSSL